MSDLYSELLVKKKQTAKDLVVKYGLIALTVIMVLGGLVLMYILAGTWLLHLVLHVILYYRDRSGVRVSVC